MLLPTCKLGTPEIDPKVYELVRQKWEEEKKSNSGYTATAFHQGGEK